MKTLTSLLLALSLTLNLASCGGGDGVCGGGDGVCNYADSPQTPFTSGTQVYDKAPTPTGSQSPEIAMISYNNVVTPGSTLRLTIHLNGSAADISEAVLAESGAANHTVLSVSSAEITNNSITFEVTLSEALATEETLELEIGVVDYNGNVSEYHHVLIQLSADEQYAITSYSGDSDFDISGSWKETMTSENGGTYAGKTWIRQAMITQDGNGLIITEQWFSLKGNVTGNGNFITLTFDGTYDSKQWGEDYHIDTWYTWSGEVIDNDKIVGEVNWIVKRTYGDDTNGTEAVSVKFDVVITRGSSLGDDHGNNNTNASFVPFNTDIKGELEDSGDVDTIGFWATEGKTYTIKLISDSLSDGEITLCDWNGDILPSDTSKITWTCNSCNIKIPYYVKVESSSNTTGTYTIKVQESN